MLNRLKSAWSVMRGRAAAVPAIRLEGVVNPLDLRPDPTARFNVFREWNGQLVLNDPQRYSGNSIKRAGDAFEFFRDSDWLGTVYVYDGDALIERIVR